MLKCHGPFYYKIKIIISKFPISKTEFSRLSTEQIFGKIILCYCAFKKKAVLCEEAKMVF